MRPAVYAFPLSLSPVRVVKHAFFYLVAASCLWHTAASASAQASVQDDACSGSVSSSACEDPAPVHHEVPAYARHIYRMSVDMHAGAAGIGTEFAAPLTHRFDLRAGSDFFSYSTVVNRYGNAYNVEARLRSSRLAADVYLTHHHAFRVSPLMVFANSSHGQTSVNLGAGQSMTFNHVTYYSNPADPLHGVASVDLRRVSPGLSVGFGHLIPSRGHHVSFPFEAGFYYAGTPVYKMQAAGSACTNQLGQVICQDVQNNAAFQYNLAQFKAKYQPYVNYATFFPVLSSGVAFAF